MITKSSGPSPVGHRRTRQLLVVAALLVGLLSVVAPASAGADAINPQGGRGSSFAYCYTNPDFIVVGAKVRADAFAGNERQLVAARAEIHVWRNGAWSGPIRDSGWKTGYTSGIVDAAGNVYFENAASFNLGTFDFSGYASYKIVVSYGWKHVFWDTRAEAVTQFFVNGQLTYTPNMPYCTI